jgi:MATE family multidrug resistance protein
MLKLAGPIVLGEIGWVTMSIVDTMMVGRLPSSALAIGAVSLGSIAFYAVAIFGMGLLIGLDTVVSQAHGAGRVEDTHHSLVNGTWLSLAMAPVLMAITWLWGPVLGWMGLAPNLIDNAIPYLHALVWGMPPLLLYFVFRRYLQGINQVNPVMFALLSANLVNLLCNWVLIYGHWGLPALGVAGSGWSTCIARTYLGAVLLGCIFYYDHRQKAGLRTIRRRPHYGRIQELMRLGFPAAMQFSIEVGVFGAAAALIGKLGAVPLASHQIALNVASFSYMVPLGISSAAAVRVGQALGRGDPRGASHSGWTAIAIGAGFMACAAIVFVTVPRQIVRLFTPDANVIRAGAQLLVVAALFQLFDGIQGVATGALRGAGNTRTPMICHLVCYWLIGLPLGWWLCFRRGWGAVGIWSGLCGALVLIGMALLTVWYRLVQAKE